MIRGRSSRSTLRWTVAAAAAAGLVAGMATASAASAAPAAGKLAPGAKVSTHKIKSSSDRPAGLPKKGSFAFLLTLDAKSTSSVFGTTKRAAGTASAKRAARAQLATVKTAQNRVIAALPAKSRVLYRTHAVTAGVTVLTDVNNYEALRRIRGVASVHPIAPKKIDNSYAVPFQGGAAAWAAYGDLGENSSIAIIDTGVDYTHANLGGPGTVNAYDTAKAADTTAPDPGSYDHAKFDATTVDTSGNPIYMWDFAGDDYNADPTSASYQPYPSPDPNPLDCNGHGSHVAGTAAGLGENADGTTYAGAYNASTPFDTMRIGPGVAPMAHIYAYRVFGCDGSSDVVGEAIDKAMDPNGDGDTSDHADVVNMSLGSDYGFPDDGDSVLTNEASQIAGVTMVVASGNGGDVYDIGGSPGNAVRSIAVANSQDAYSQVDALTLSAPAGLVGDYAAERSVAYDWGTKPDLAGDVALVSDPTNLEGCKPLNNTDKAAVNGKIAFVNWTNNPLPCGSVTRSGNLAAAGAIGFIFGSDEENFSAGITGSTAIPGVLVSKSGADAIRAELEAAHTVTVSGTGANSFRQIIAGLDDTVNSSSSRGIRDAGNVKPDVSAVGTTVFSTAVGTGTEGVSESGTSMATPMVAGTAALVTSKHQDWTPEQVKADIMNTADADLYLNEGRAGAKYAPNRVGAGRIDIKSALDNSVLAYTTDGPNGTSTGNVSASFGPVAVPVNGGIWTRSKTIKVQNTGATTANYDVSFDNRTTIPGATYTVTPSTVSVAAHQAATVKLTLTIDPTKLTKTIDPTVSPTVPLPTGNPAHPTVDIPRQFVADASGLVTFSSTDVNGTDLRVPAYAAPRPASTMTQASSVTLAGTSSARALLRLSGSQVQQGTGAAGIQSIVAGFELQATSGVAPKCSSTRVDGCWDTPSERAADLKYVGSTSDAPQLRSNGQDPMQDGLAYFAITTQVPFRHASSPQTYEIDIDGNGDHKVDAIAYTTRIATTEDTDILVSELVDVTNPNLPQVVDDEPINASFGDTDTAIFDSDTLVLPVAIGLIPGVTSAKSRINYAVFGFDGYHDAPLDQVGSVDRFNRISGGLSMDVLHPGVTVAGGYDGSASPLLFQDSPGGVLALTRNTPSFAADRGKGALLIHFHNAVGHKAQVVTFKKASVRPRVSFAHSIIQRGKSTSATVTVSGQFGAGQGTVTVYRLAGHGLRTVVVARGHLSHGKLSFTYRAPRVKGSFYFRASYSGDGSYNPGTSYSARLIVR